jgi:hypothetical protein
VICGAPSGLTHGMTRTNSQPYDSSAEHQPSICRVAQKISAHRRVSRAICSATGRMSPSAANSMFSIAGPPSLRPRSLRPSCVFLS